MNMNIWGIKKQPNEACQFTFEHIGEFAHRSIRVLKQVIGHIRQDAYLTGVTFAVANIAFVEIARRVVKLIQTNLLDPILQFDKDNRSMVFLLGLTISVVTVMNISLYKSLKPTLSPWVTTAISLASSVGYCFYIALMSNKS